MPLATEPNQTFKVILEIDKGKSPAEQPYFEFKLLSLRDWNNLAKVEEELKNPALLESMTGQEATDKILGMIKCGLVNWGNMKDPQTGSAIAFDPKELDALLTLQEVQELLVKFRNQGLEVEDKKKSDSRSASNMDKAASDALESPGAKTNPMPSSPS
jgi:hypothetical protein